MKRIISTLLLLIFLVSYANAQSPFDRKMVLSKMQLVDQYFMDKWPLKEIEIEPSRLLKETNDWWFQ